VYARCFSVTAAVAAVISEHRAVRCVYSWRCEVLGNDCAALMCTLHVTLSVVTQQQQSLARCSDAAAVA
jgi:hypothetical protein